MDTATMSGVVILTFIYGFRHGVDWDHITAIVDLVSSASSKRRGFLLTLWYAAGHEVCIAALGALAVFLGYTLPHTVDNVMERFVGITLLLLAALSLMMLIKGDSAVRISRWRVLVFGFYNVFGWMARRIDGRYRYRSPFAPVYVGYRGALGIGLIHGIGAQTPTQMLLFITASGLGSPTSGMAAVASFVVGLLVSHVTISLLTVIGYVNAARHSRVMQWLSYGVVAYSAAMGGIFVLGRAGTLPAIL